MATTEIQSPDWEAFCSRFLDLNRGVMMTLRKIEPSGQSVEVVRDMPLTKVWMESGACNDRLFVNFEKDGFREVIHEIIDPIHIKVREEADGQKGIQIDAENGSTLILFRSGRLNELLQGLQTV